MAEKDIQKRTVPLVVYINGDRQEIGEAVIEQDFSTPNCDVSVVVTLDKDTPLWEQLEQIIRRHKNHKPHGLAGTADKIPDR